ncbi:uncharacterized protein M437DRAFT_67731 [Aureobasidium melanogenum CBS 110374]|uniref:Leucine-rich repeat domain-containing protein n=1 Tax=Aureobasidium melanogenum (strain CBS 110374) TaxID=1043003 RepID=A0A074VTB5_AURM1|nr:uncharacterized protein M437DRAFT_67731 [Aureobasidium melanogenum CBS 110374]KEQ60957.1 hypothetical protein M437DRAFT_67731 [Aureobasidium melanogenum CBS 110374]
MLHLPQDIQLCIVGYFSTETFKAPEQHNAWKTATKTLSSLCLTSRGMCALAQPLLYRTFVRLSKGSEPDIHGVVGSDIGVKATKTLELFIRTLLDRPSLADLVWYIYYEKSDTPEEDTRALDETLLSKCLESTQRIPAFDPGSENYDWHDTWCSDLAKGRDDAIIALLLTLVPNLKHLDIKSFRMTFNRHFGVLVKQSLGIASWVKDESSSTASVPSFKLVTSAPRPKAYLPFIWQLECLFLRKQNWRHSNVDIVYMPLFYIPTLKSLNLINTWEFFKDNAANYQMPPLGNVQHLRVEGVESCSPGLVTLIGNCSNLNSLEYVSTGFSFLEARLDQKWLDVLEKRANTLKRLQLILYYTDYYSDGMVDSISQFDLRGLSQLVFLEISQDIIIPEFSSQRTELLDLLPSSLESLVIRDIDVTFTTTLSRFVEQDGFRYFPQLRYVELVEKEDLAGHCSNSTESSENFDIDRISWSAARTQLIEMCQKAGVKCKV